MEENNFLIRQIQKSQKEEKTSELKLGEQLSQIILKGVSEMREKHQNKKISQIPEEEIVKCCEDIAWN